MQVRSRGLGEPVPERTSVLNRCAMLALVLGLMATAWSVLRPVPSEPRAVNTGPNVHVPELPLSDLHIVGRDDASAVIVEFSDFECPYCGEFSRKTLPTLKSRYVQPGAVQLAFANFPLPNHRNAVSAAATAECAGRHGRFWSMHDKLFSSPSRLDAASLSAHIAALGLDSAGMDACRRSEGVSRVHRDVELARAFRVSATPTFFIGRRNSRTNALSVTRVLVGAKPIADFDEALASVLN